MRRSAAAFIVAVWAGFAAGCVERRMTVYSEPTGAMVYCNGRQIGNSPVDDHFVYYGKYKFTLVKPGYATLQVTQTVRRWYQSYPLDLISEIFWPFQIEDVRVFQYKMQPLTTIPIEQIANDGGKLRQEGKAVVLSARAALEGARPAGRHAAATHHGSESSDGDSTRGAANAGCGTRNSAGNARGAETSRGQPDAAASRNSGN